MPKDISCTIASLNTNSIIKTNNQKTQNHYIQFLKDQKFNILCLQETHTSTITKIEDMTKKFMKEQNFWTSHVGIVSFSPEYMLTIIDTTEIYDSDRYQLCKVQHPHHFYEPFYILNLYAPAHLATERCQFYKQLVQLIETLVDQNTIALDKLIILGDFNYSHLRPSQLSRSTDDDWQFLLDANFFNSMRFNDMASIPTFQRSHNTDIVASTIDYIYVGESFSLA